MRSCRHLQKKRQKHCTKLVQIRCSWETHARYPLNVGRRSNIHRDAKLKICFKHVPYTYPDSCSNSSNSFFSAFAGGISLRAWSLLFLAPRARVRGKTIQQQQRRRRNEAGGTLAVFLFLSVGRSNSVPICGCVAQPDETHAAKRPRRAANNAKLDK